MDLIQIIVLALLQGLTEFLPISSSGHLILVPRLLGWPDQGLAFDVAVHVGTLLAVVWYFRRDLIDVAGAWFSSLRGGGLTPEARLAWAVLLGTVPVGLAGLAFKDFIEIHLRSELVIATTTAGFGVALWLADRLGTRQRDERHLTFVDVLVIGVAQAIALIPGTSRSGITITAGLAMGLTRQAAARFSFLLSIPVIVLAGGLETIDLIRDGESAQWQTMILAAALSAVSAYVCIATFLRLLDRIGMLPFALYRLALAAVLFWVFA